MKKYPFIFIVILLFHFSGFGFAQSQQSGNTTILQQNGDKSAAELLSEATAAYQNKDFLKSAQLFQAAVAKGAREPHALYDTACSLALAGDKEKAFEFLIRSIEGGFRNTDHLMKDGDLNSLHDDQRWAKVIAASKQQQVKYLADHSDPNKTRFVTSDIARFWKVYDKALGVAPDERAAIFQREYIEPGTIGLTDFSRSGRLNANTLAKMMQTHPTFFDSIRKLTLDIGKQRAQTIKALRRLKELYPQAIFPDSYFVVGQLQSGGTTSDNGLLMGAEMFTRSPGVPVAELNDWEKGAIMEQGEIPPLVAHEAIHFQQKFPSQNSLLCACLKEGGADFLGELTSGRLVTRMQKTHVWANARERQLWEEFQTQMLGLNTSRWLYGNSGKDNRPVDLGYWMGYKISEAYYKGAGDKRQAIRDILLVTDCKEFLNASRYAEKFADSKSDPKSLSN